GRELADVERDQDPHWKGHQGRAGDDDDAADEHVRYPASGLAERRRRLGEEVPAERGDPAAGNGVDHKHQHGNRREGRQRCDRLHDEIYELSPPRSRAQLQRVPGSVDRHQLPPARWYPNRRAMYCAIRFTISEITSRIAARYSSDATWMWVTAPWY